MRAEVSARLRERRAEIEEAILARVYGVEQPAGDAEPEYLHGLRAAVSASLDYALSVVELGEERSPPLPMVLLAQARLAARYGVGLDVVIRRYISGYTLLTDFVLREAEPIARARSGVSLHRLLHAQTSQMEALIAAVSEEYQREVALRPLSGEERRVERVKRLLAGAVIDPDELAYEFNGWHVAVIQFDNAGIRPLQMLAAGLDCRLLVVQPDSHTIWGWLGGRRKPAMRDLEGQLIGLAPPTARLALGEPGSGLAGWRLSHNQAKAVAPFADAGRPPVRYADLGIVATLSRDEIAVKSLEQLYLAPLSDERDGGAALRDTLRAYFSSGRNISSAAAALRVNRQTVRNRLKVVEEKLGCSLDVRGAGVELALEIEHHLPLEPHALN